VSLVTEEEGDRHRAEAPRAHHPDRGPGGLRRRVRADLGAEKLLAIGR
jgi:hypothetical protein